MKNLSFVKPIINFYLVGLVIITLSRFLLFLFFYDRITETENFLRLFPIGLRIDLILLSYIAILPTFFIVFLPTNWLQKGQYLIRYFFIICLIVLLFMELATPNFLIEYDTRPNRLFIEYLKYPKEVGATLLKGYGFIILLVIIVLIGVIYFLNRFSKKWFKIQDTPYKWKLILFPLVGFLLFFGARSSLTSVRPINASNAIFSTDQFTNSLALNSTYTVAFAIYSLKFEEDIIDMYGKMDAGEAVQRVKKYMTAKEEDFTNKEIPLLHRQLSSSKKDKPYNLVIFLQESLGAEYVGCLGGLPLTPNIDNLAKEGMLFTNLYATGTRSVRGIEAVVTGFLPTPSTSVVKLGKSQNGFYSLADNLGRKGYATSFVYGGMANFDNMAAFFNGNGFEKIIDESDYKDGEFAFKGIWGVSDEDLVNKANKLYKSYGDKPFFSLLFSTSNHSPFEFPDGRIELYEEPKNTVHNAMKYADYAIGEFFKLAKNEPYFKNTVFIVISDHNTRTYGNHLVPIHKFHIPALIIAPNVEKGTTYEKLCSQIDIPPTLLDLIGMDVETPMPGRDLIQLADSIPGRASMQFHEINAFRNGDDLLIMQPKTKHQQFKITKDNNLVEVELDPELSKDALGHILTASNMYQDRSYRLPNQK